MAKEGLTVQSLEELKEMAEVVMLKKIREQVEWFQDRTGVVVTSVTVDITHYSATISGLLEIEEKGIPTDVNLEIKI